MSRKIFIFCFLLLILMGLTSASHKFYVSLTQVDINEKSLHLEVSVRIFTDDLEKTIVDQTGIKLRLGTEKEYEKADSILYNYFSTRLSFKQEQQTLDLVFIGKEPEFDGTWLYLESELPVQTDRPFNIGNGILLEEFPDQKNIMNLRYGKTTVSQIHSKEHPEYQYELER